jgi:hypothetical protein
MRHPLFMVIHMAQIRFHPHFDTTLSKVLASAAENGTVAITCQGLDALVLASQVIRFAADRGADVNCTPVKGRVEVTIAGRAAHPSNRSNRPGQRVG